MISEAGTSLLNSQHVHFKIYSNKADNATWMLKKGQREKAILLK